MCDVIHDRPYIDAAARDKASYSVNTTTPTAEDLRILAFYLPQYHPIAENNAWWGQGFTDWRNVSKARPLFTGHEQPHIPADLGYYDLRLPEARQSQAELARSSGVHGFVYYHYWFKGRLLLERPFTEVLASRSPSFPFALCWAYESWSRTWDGNEREVLLRQQVSVPDQVRHAHHLAPALLDERNIRVGESPIFLVYKGSSLPEVERIIECWRETWQSYAIHPYIIRVDSSEAVRPPPRSQGFDAAVQFAPNFASLPARIRRTFAHRLYERLFQPGRGYRLHNVYDYDDNVRLSLDAQRSLPGDETHYPCVFPSWDNSPRRVDWALLFRGSTPDRFERWLRESARLHQRRSPEENLLFVNAWNEWAEGAHLEPDWAWGHAYLDAVARVTGVRRCP